MRDKGIIFLPFLSLSLLIVYGSPWIYVVCVEEKGRSGVKGQRKKRNLPMRMSPLPSPNSPLEVPLPSSPTTHPCCCLTEADALHAVTGCFVSARCLPHCHKWPTGFGCYVKFLIESMVVFFPLSAVVNCFSYQERERERV